MRKISMNDFIWKNKVIVLWVLSILNFIAVLTMPDALALTVEEVGAALSPLITFYFFLTAIMTWLSLVAAPGISRWPIILVGAFYAFVKIRWIITSMTGDILIHLFINELWGLIVSLMLVWYGWRIPIPVDGHS